MTATALKVCLHWLMTNDAETRAIENTSIDNSGAPLPDLHIILRPPALVVNTRTGNEGP